MRLAVLPILLAAALTPAAGAAASRGAPTIFAPGAIAGPFDDGAAAFTPDGNTVVFMRGTDSFTLMESHRVQGHWSTPQPASFSGQWRDLDPSMAPDGSYLLFVSNRPAKPGQPPLDAVFGTQRHPGNGMNLWRVDRRGNRWGTPVRLPDRVNACSTTFAPSIAGDGSVYYIGCDPTDGTLQLLHAWFRDGRYQAPFRVKIGGDGVVIRDPAIAPDRAFLVVSMKPVGSHAPYRLAISFHSEAGWSMPQDLGDAVNGGKHSMGAQLGPDHRTLYFYSDRKLASPDPQATAAWNNGDDHIWQVSLEPWLDAHRRIDP